MSVFWVHKVCREITWNMLVFENSLMHFHQLIIFSTPKQNQMHWLSGQKLLFMEQFLMMRPWARYILFFNLQNYSGDLHFTKRKLSLSEGTPGLPWWLSGKEHTCQCRRCKLDPWVGTIPGRRKWWPTPVSLPGKSHWQRSQWATVTWGPKRVRPGLGTETTTKGPQRKDGLESSLAPLHTPALHTKPWHDLRWNKVNSHSQWRSGSHG